MKRKYTTIMGLFAFIILTLFVISIFAKAEPVSDPENNNPVSPKEFAFTYEDIGNGIWITAYHSNDVQDVMIPDTLDGKAVLGIGDEAFSHHAEIVSISLPVGITSIGSYAFFECCSLKAITIPDTVHKIGTAAFFGCSSLSTVVLGNELEFIGPQSFWECSALTAIIIPSNVSTLGDQAFFGCRALSRMSIKNKAIAIGKSVFSNCGRVILYGYANSTAKAYAENVHIPFVTIAINTDYQTYIEDAGWQDWKSDGMTSGALDQSLSLEGFKATLNCDNKYVTINYQARCANKGWLDWQVNGAPCDTGGESNQLEAIRFRLTGTNAADFDVYYQVFTQNFGWLNWARDGEIAGTEDFGYPLKAIRVVVVPAGSTAPGATTTPFVSNNIYCSYRTRVSNIGWMDWMNRGEMSGTTGQGLGLEAIEIATVSSGYELGVQYQTSIQNIGWMDWKAAGAMSGSSDQSRMVEAIRISLIGKDATRFEVYYQVYNENYGWLDWAKDGRSAGTEGYGYPLEAIRIVVVPKDFAAPGPTAQPFLKN